MGLILGLDAPTSGSATVGGQIYRDLPAPLREVGALIDTGSVHPKRTAYHHLLALAQSNAIPAARVAEVLGQVGLDAAAGRRVGDFSLGMTQRLGIAAALLGDPPVLMFRRAGQRSRPGRHRLGPRIDARLGEEGRTVLVSSHLMTEMALTADHLIVVGKGRLLRDEGMNEFVEAGSEHWVLVWANRLADLSALVVAAGGQVRPGPEESLEVSGFDAVGIGELADGHGRISPRASRRARWRCGAPRDAPMRRPRSSARCWIRSGRSSRRSR